MKIILAGHGKIGTSMLESTEMVIGECNNFYSVEFHKGESPEDILDKYRKIIGENINEDILILTDLFGGSPYNAAAMLAMTNEKVEVLTGLSLPLCAELATMEAICAKESVEYLKNSSKDFVVSFRDQIIDDEEEL
ncbi:MAG: PTS sugar transporter subunit IIA [Sebaldella sp.]|nr:PTS sugar transporter subunit IIA [Sebaldella sp.]